MYRISRIAAVACIMAAIGVASAQSQTRNEADTYPNRPVHVTVGFAAGGGTDTIARFIGEALSGIWHQPVVIDNRPGAGGQIAEGFVAKAVADGYMLLADSASLTISPSLGVPLPYDIKDFAPISLVSSSPYVLLANPGVPAKSVKDLIALAKAEPGKLNYASAGVGSSLHLAGELFKSMAGVDIIHVPYQGANGLVDLISGRVQLAFAGLPQALPHIKSGKLKALAVTSPTRSALLPDVPTVAESGLPGYEVISWYGLLAPAGTPKPIVAKISESVSQALKAKEIRDRFLTLGLEPVGSNSDDFATHIKAEMAKWTQVVKEAGIKPE